MSDTPRICPHGSLRRSCEVCDLADECDRLERERDAARALPEKTS